LRLLKRINERGGNFGPAKIFVIYLLISVQNSTENQDATYLDFLK